MTSKHERDLEAILDDALDAFDSLEHPEVPDNNPALHHNTQPSADVDEAPPLSSAPHNPSPEERPPSLPSADDEAGRALEDALRALGELGVGDSDLPASADADMKLVEDFVATLGESLAALGGDPSSTNPIPNNASSSAASTSSSAASRNGPQQATAGKPNGDQPPAPPAVEKLVECIVGHLFSEDVLKQPMQQLRKAYAEWLPKHEDALAAADVKRFRRQQELVEEICKRYEGGGDVSEVMELLSLMQETGAPPEAVMNQFSGDGGLDGLMEKLGGFDMGK